MTKTEVQSKVAAFGTSIKTPAAQLFLHLPLWLLVIAILYYAIPRVDPRSGIDGWGSIWNMFVIGFAMALSSFASGIITRRQFRAWTHADKVKTTAFALAGDWQAVTLFAIERLLFLVLWMVGFLAMVGK